MLIGILQTGQAPSELRPTLGDYPDLFQSLLAERGLTFRTYHVEDMQFPGDVQDCDGWLITGSRHGAYEDHPFIAPLEGFIRRAYEASVPLVGICFGHQIIAQALGGKVEKFAGGWAIGPQDYDIGGETLRLNAWHQDQVTERPAGAEVFACNDFCTNAGLVYGDRAWTIQPHPEFADSFVQGLIDTRARGTVPDAQIDAAAAALGAPLAQSRMADQIAEFFQRSRK